MYESSIESKQLFLEDGYKAGHIWYDYYPTIVE